MYRLFDLHIDEVSGVDRPANGRKFLVVKHAKKEDKMDEKQSVADLEKQIAELETARDVAVKDVEETKGVFAKLGRFLSGKNTEDTLSEDPDIADLQKRTDEAEQRAIAAEGRVTKLEAFNANRDMVELAKGLPGAGDDVSEELAILKTTLSPKRFADYVKRQRGNMAVMKSSVLFTEMGAGDAGSEKGEDKLVVMAKAVQKAEPTLTYEAAYAKAILTPEGQTAYAEHAKKGDN